MRTDIDPGIVALFGGETRVLTLAALANSERPLTGYRVTKLTGLQPTKVYDELRRLASAEVVRAWPVDNGRANKVWTISDPDLRAFVRKRVRLVSAAEWAREVDERVRRRKPIASGDLGIDLSRYRANPSAVPNRREFERPASKDRALASAGLRVSRRKNLRR
ncbi:MAG: hypothetical protein WAN87_00110 [Thermoplasmata archaeon]